MFAYCSNNPLVYCDSEGNRPISALSVAEETKEERQQSFAYMKSHSRNKATQANGTVSLGLSGSGSIGPWGFSVQAFITSDSHGNIALQTAWSGGISSHVIDKSFAAAITPFVMLTNAPRYENLEGKGASLGVTLPANYTIIADYNMMLDDTGTEILYHGVSVGVGLGAGKPEVHAMWGGEAYTLISMPARDFFKIIYF